MKHDLNRDPLAWGWRKRLCAAGLIALSAYPLAFLAYCVVLTVRDRERIWPDEVCEVCGRVGAELDMPCAGPEPDAVPEPVSKSAPRVRFCKTLFAASKNITGNEPYPYPTR